MSQAEQVPEDMPAYLNHEPVGTGKPLTFDVFFLQSHHFQDMSPTLVLWKWVYEK